MSELLSSRWLSREKARLKLARLKLEGDGALPRALTCAIAICAQALGVKRVGIWEIEPDENALRLTYLRDESDPSQSPGTVLPVDDLGAYEALLRSRRVLAIEDVRTSPITVKMVDTYLAQRGITALLDVPIYLDARVIGVVCHEHRGGPRTWTADDAAFAISVAEMVALFFASDALRRAELATVAVEKEFQDALRADTMADVTRSIAHDVNNLLGAISMQTALLRQHPDDSDAVGETTARVMHLVDSAARLTRCLLDQTRRETSHPPTTAVREAIERSAAMLRSLAGEDRAVTVHTEDIGRDVNATIDQMALERVLCNLVANARNASVPGGVIAVRCHLKPTAVDCAKAGRSVVIEVSDDGRGFDEETRERIFEPKFTTQSSSGHHGLGLSSVRTMVSEAGGEITVESTPGEGTRFVIVLPTE